MPARALEASELCAHSDPTALPFSSTAELEPTTEPLGQQRAVEALRFAMSQTRPGYNVLVVGPAGHGKHAFVQSVLLEAGANRAPPSDWCYVHNFEVTHQPRALELPAGRGRELARDLEKLVEDLRAAIPAAFESEQFRRRIKEIEDEFRQRPETILQQASDEARRADIAMARMPNGFAFAPIRGGEVMAPEDFEALPESEKKRVQDKIAELEAKIEKGLEQLPRWAKEARERVRELRREVTRHAVEQMMEELRTRYAELPRVQAYLDDVHADLLEHADDFKKQDEPGDLLSEMTGHKPFNRYRVNLVVDHSASRGAPIVYDDRPTLDHLVGRIEHLAQLGALISDFTLIKPGSLHAANGGYLVLDLKRLLSYPHAWESLKRALFSHELRIESLSQVLGLTATATLEPESIPLELKVVLIGDRLLAQLLGELDPDVGELFRVVAEFDDRVERSGETSLAFARQLATIAKSRTLRPLEASAVARVLDHAARLAGDGCKLATSWREIEVVLDEADDIAGRRSAELISPQDVQHALDARTRRRDLVQKRVQEAILRGTLLVDSTGAKPGQINGLSVIEIGGIPFGWPTRITATARVGSGSVVDVEREVELGGALHSKGVLILSSYFAARYAQQIPLSLSASLVFEQSYGGVEGDSASLAELCALISCLAAAPIRQSIAVTGSVNQLGEAQAIGAVNDKIEGFFEICRQRGLSGEQGVVIPAANVPHLMLSDEVVAACAAGQFHVWAVTHVDEAIELLTGIDAGVANADGEFPEGSINGRAYQQLMMFAVIAEGFRNMVKVEAVEEDKRSTPTS